MTGSFSVSRSPCELRPLISNSEHAQGEPGGHGGRGPRKHRARREEHHGRRGLADKPLSPLTDQLLIGRQAAERIGRQNSQQTGRPALILWTDRFVYLNGLTDWYCEHWQINSAAQWLLSTLQRTGRQTREWTGRDLTPLGGLLADYPSGG